MKAINLSLAPVELDPVNGAGMLAVPTEGSEDHIRELEEVTDHENALARAGTILLLDSAGHKRTPKVKPEPLPAPQPVDDEEND